MTRTISRAVYVALGLFLIAAMPVLVSAQTTPINADFISGYGLRNLENAAVIRATPANPGPGESVQLSVDSPIYDLTHGDITWFVNGKTIQHGIGLRSAQASVNAKGDPLDIVVTVSDPVWGIASDEIVITPLQLDILYDAPSYVPPFYRGRSMPAGGGKMRLQALARFFKSGVRVSDSAITYTWKRNGVILGSVSGAGKSSVLIDAPSLFGADTISVHATANDETISADASVSIPSKEPVIALYQDHPLFGLLLRQAYPQNILEPGNITVAAIPYFATVSSLRDSAIQYRWTMNGAQIQASSSKQYEVEINIQEDKSVLGLNLTHATNFFLNAASAWTFFTNSAGGSIKAPDRAQDAFHNNQI